MRSLHAHVNAQTAAALSFSRQTGWSGMRSCALDLYGVLTSKPEQRLRLRD